MTIPKGPIELDVHRERCNLLNETKFMIEQDIQEAVITSKDRLKSLSDAEKFIKKIFDILLRW